RGMLTYGELDRRADRLARRLRRWGVGPEVVVPFCLERSTTVLVAMLGILKAGGAYLPLDSNYPVERLSFMLADSGAPVVLTQERLAATVREALPEPAPGVMVLDGTRSGDFGNGNGNGIGNGKSGPGNLAYVIYTSGSTGRPKGVEIRHSGLVNLVRWHQRTYAVTPSDRATQVAGLSFDASVREIWPYLTAGASLHLPDQETRSTPSKLVSWLAAEAVTIGFQPTPMAEALLAEPWPPRTALRALLTGGDRLLKRPGEGSPGGGQMGSPPWALFNHYGPTENTVVTTAGPVRSQASRLPTIGRPLANTSVYVVDRRLRPVPIGVVGELVTRGAGLARGYTRRPALTAERFVPDPLSGDPRFAGGRLYRTGDLVRWRGDGRIEFLGRIDHQVKIRGFRIELGEIEVVLGEHPGVAEAVVMSREEETSGKRLVAWVVAAEGSTPVVAELRRYLAERLPDYMVPGVVVLLETLPLLPSGKVDRTALVRGPLPESEWGAAYAAPRSPVEEMLADIWTEVLGRSRVTGRVGIHDDFFELGGHSLLAIQVTSRVRAAFGLDLPLHLLFEKPTVAAFAQSVEAALAAGSSGAPAIEPLPRQGRLPLSFGQQRLWFLDQLKPGAPSCDMPPALRPPRTLDRTALAGSLN
ncbi:MAG: amino acid adenylation domain-containing protein, partial [bacterium]|nr:amino acid adenylation domain-containing protein [bacterium]